MEQVTSQQDVLFTSMAGEGGDLGIITLNRPRALNALSHSMINAMHEQLTSWREASHIKAVVIQAAEGRAFCAGGDLRLAYERYISKDPELFALFRDEYTLNQMIFHFPKPYIALLDGITMGGGAGISLHGSHRVATENLLFAMPETGIGFFPDVGGTYFLSHLPDYFGHYLGLSGAKITSEDCIALGLAQYHVKHASLPKLVASIAADPFHGDAKSAVAQVIQKFVEPSSNSSLIAHRAAIAACFGGDSVEEILNAAEQSAHDICLAAAKAIREKSPTSLKVTLRALQQGAKLNFDDCMQQERCLAPHFLTSHDFFEGIRAVVIDKDHTPHWEPASLREVPEQEVGRYFNSALKLER